MSDQSDDKGLEDRTDDSFEDEEKGEEDDKPVSPEEEEEKRSEEADELLKLSSRETSVYNFYDESDGGYSSPRIQESPNDVDDGGGKAFQTWESALEYLGKDHSLLRPFHEAKKKQLLRDKDMLLLQLRQAEQQAKDVEEENVKMGGELYRLQEDVTRAQVKLDETKAERVKVKISKKSTEDSLKKAQQADKEQQELISKTREKELALFMELSKADRKLSLAKVLHSKGDSDLAALRQALEGAIHDKTILQKNKGVQEFHLERLKSFLNREENTLSILQQASERAVEETETLKTAVKDQKLALEAVEQESKTVEKAWEENVFIMEKRSEKFSEELKAVISLRADEAGLRNEITNIRKAVKETQLEHERSTHRLLRLEDHVLSNRTRLMAAEEKLIMETEKKQDLEESISKLTEEHVQAQKIYDKEVSTLNWLYKRLANTTNHHRRLEDKSLEKFDKQTTASKANEKLRANIKKLKEKGRTLEDEMILEEQLTAREALRLSVQKNSLKNLLRAKEKAQKILDQNQKNAEEKQMELRRKEEKIKSNSNILERLKVDLNRILELTKGSEEPPLERKERALQIDLKEAEKTLLRLEREALLLQKDFLLNSKKKQNLEQKKHELNKELQLLNSRSSRLAEDVQNEKLSFGRLELLRKRLEAAMKVLDGQLYEGEVEVQELTHSSGVMETEMSLAIKDLEKELREENHYLESLKNELELSDMKLTEALMEKNKWHERLVSGKQAKEEYLKEKGAEGEMGVMKKEINRMNVRWHSLEATQRELSKQLAKSVEMEDALKYRVSSVFENAIRNPHSLKATKEMHIDALKRRISKNQKILNEIQQNTESLQEQKRQVQNDLEMKQKMYSNHVKMLQEADITLQEKLSVRQLDQIYLQEERMRLRYLNSLKENRYRNLAASNEEAQKALDISLGKRIEAYRNVIRQLVTAYPHLTRPLSAANRLLDLKRD